MRLIGPGQSFQFMEWHNVGITTLKQASYMCPKCSWKNCRKTKFYLANLLKFCDNILHKLFRPSQFLEKFFGHSGMVHFAEIN